VDDAEILEMYTAYLAACNARDWARVAGDRSPVETDEFAMYRIAEGRIAELWGTADNARLRL
jgi:predicted ester cyclase